MKFVLLALVLTAAPLSAHAAARRPLPCSTTKRPAIVESPDLATSSGVTVVPFAVPVAVPVAVIHQPAFFYSYQQHAPHPLPRMPDEAQPPVAESPQMPAKPPAPAPAENAESASSAQTVALLTERCAKCHTGEAPKGHLSMFDATGQLLPRLPRRAILEMAAPDESGAQRMPPGELPKLTAAQVAALRHWARPPRDLAY